MHHTSEQRRDPRQVKISPSHVTIAASCTRCHGLMMQGLAGAAERYVVAWIYDPVGRYHPLDHRTIAKRQQLHRTRPPIGYFGSNGPMV